MTTEDFEQLRDLGRHVQDLPRIGLLSPVRRRRRRPPWRRNALSEHAVFPSATSLSQRDWSLDVRGARSFDLIVASNVFMYSPEPSLWFDHVLDACAYLLMVDLVRRRRSASSELGTDGDCMRYAIGEARPRLEGHFDLGVLGERLLGFRTYPGGANPYDDDPLHFIALVEGALADSEHVPAGVRALLAEIGSAQPGT